MTPQQWANWAITGCYNTTAPLALSELSARVALVISQANREAAKAESHRRAYYQEIVYYVCNVLDNLDSKPIGKGLVCGTFETPSKQVQERMNKLRSGPNPNEV
jgi:hypothetical protein